MFLNSREKPHELLYLEALAARTELNEKERKKLKALQRGYEGECLYDHIFNEIGHEGVYILRDLYLKIGESVTQYDTLIINDMGITVNEIKNYTGEYNYEGGRWFRGKYPVPEDAFSQLNRSVGKLRRLINDAQGNSNVSGKIIFPSDDFYLQTDNQSIWEGIIVRSVLKRYFREFRGSKISNKAKYIVRIVSSCIVENPYFKPEVNTERLKLGLYCGCCGSFNLMKSRFHLTCLECGSKESNETHLLRSMSDYKFLYFGKKMTRNALVEFIGKDVHWKTVSRALLKHCFVNKKGVATTYQFKYYDFRDALKKSDCHTKYKDYLVTK